LREAHGITEGRSDRARTERHQVAARAQMDEAAWATAWVEGRAMSLEQVIASALEGLPPPDPQSP